MTATLSAIHIFPIKSCAPLRAAAARVEPRGLCHDRRWMVADADGVFITGRQQPRLTLIHAQPDGEGLLLSAPGMPSLCLVASRERVAATIWKNSVVPLAASLEADAWISAYLGQPARFLHMDEDCIRPVDLQFARVGDEVSFADGYPLLLISQAALDELNTKLVRPVPMLRFRPNFVVADTTAHAEDGWKRVRIGAVEFDVVKPCSRCVFTTVDLERGELAADGEPLRTLSTYRRTPMGIAFGQNLIPRGVGSVHIGDAVEVLA